MTTTTFGPDTPEGSWETIKQLAGRLGRELLEKALVAYNVAVDPTTPLKARATLFAALAYLGMPLDAIPDALVGVGYTDDFTVLVAAILAVASSVRPRHIRAARATMRNLGIQPQTAEVGLDDDGSKAPA